MNLEDYLTEIHRLREDICRTRLQLRLQALTVKEQMEGIGDRLELLQIRRDSRMRELMEVILKMKNPDMAEIMSLRYLENRDWSCIEEKLYLSRSQIFRLHRQGLAELKRKLPALVDDPFLRGEQSHPAPPAPEEQS